jgi:hypothetical protein
MRHSLLYFIAEISAVDLHYLMKSLGLRITSSAAMGLIPSFSISLRSALLSKSNGASFKGRLKDHLICINRLLIDAEMKISSLLNRV